MTPERNVTVYATTGKGMEVFKSTASVFGELIREFAEHGIDFNMTTHKVNITGGPFRRVTFEVADAELPAGPFTVVIVQKEGKAGAEKLEWPEDDVDPSQQRNRAVAAIRALGQKAIDFFSKEKEYYRLRSDEIKELIEEWNEQVEESSIELGRNPLSGVSVNRDEETGDISVTMTPSKKEIAVTIRLMMNLPDVKTEGPNREALDDLQEG